MLQRSLRMCLVQHSSVKLLKKKDTILVTCGKKDTSKVGYPAVGILCAVPLVHIEKKEFAIWSKSTNDRCINFSSEKDDF